MCLCRSMASMATLRQMTGPVGFLCLLVVVTLTSGSQVGLRKLTGVLFLVTVNVTDYSGCMATIATDMIRPDVKSRVWNISGCDHGPIHYTVDTHGDNGELTVSLIYYSYVIEDAGPPTCRISWNGTYLVPRQQGGAPDLLPVCFTTDSREGWHFTYYWFHILDWQFG